MTENFKRDFLKIMFFINYTGLIKVTFYIKYPGRLILLYMK